METLRIRCPGCQKLYGVARSEVKEPKPEFLCKKCGSKFYFIFPPVDAENVPTFLMDGANATPHGLGNKMKCPKCSYENEINAVVCVRCGLVFEKFQKRQKLVSAEIPVNMKLLSMWDEVLANYEKVEFHEKFIAAALAEKQLTVASAQYRRIIEANPSDPLAIKMRDKIIALATVTFVPPVRDRTTIPNYRYAIPLAVVALLGLIIGASNNNSKISMTSGAAFFLAVIWMAFKYFKAKSRTA